MGLDVHAGLILGMQVDRLGLPFRVVRLYCYLEY